MLHRCKPRILLQGLALFLLGPMCEAIPLGLTVNVVPLESNGGQTVRAHFTAIAPLPCPSLYGLCAEGEDCHVHNTSLPFNGTRPKSGWCVRQWQKTVPSNYHDTISLGSNTFFVSLKATPTVRENTGKLNHPAFAALPPPLRARVNCPHHFHLSVKDLDGDKVRCRFASAAEGECVNCAQHSFLELDKETCLLTFTGNAPQGEYFIYLMVEDWIPVPQARHITANTPLSTIPMHLSLNVEASKVSCSEEPVATGETPKEDATLTVNPYGEAAFKVNFISQAESVLEVAVVGPPDLFRVGFQTVGPLALMTMAWVRSKNNLTHLLPICFAVNTESMQSEPRCVWLYQRQMKTLPAGTELTCGKTEMVLVLPITSLSNVKLTELQLNSPTCPVSYNTTHLTARIALNGCGTKTVHSGTEMVYTNTLQSVQPYSVVRRRPSLILPLACRIPGVQAKGPQYKLNIPTERDVFGDIAFEIQISLPGEGPMGNFTRNPSFTIVESNPNRVRRDAEPSLQITGNSIRGAVGSKIDILYLHVMSNCSIGGAEMIVSNCIESETEDFTTFRPIIKQGCSATRALLEVATSQTAAKVYQLNMTMEDNPGPMMYIRCTVNLCMTTIKSQKCPNLCSRKLAPRAMIGSLFTSTYIVTSGPINLVVTTPAPTVAEITSANAAAASTTQNISANAPNHTSAMAGGFIVTAVSIFLQNIFLY